MISFSYNEKKADNAYVSVRFENILDMPIEMLVVCQALINCAVTRMPEKYQVALASLLRVQLAELLQENDTGLESYKRMVD